MREQRSPHILLPTAIVPVCRFAGLHAIGSERADADADVAGSDFPFRRSDRKMVWPIHLPLEALMAIRYHHTQRGMLMLAAMLVGALACASAGYFNPSSGRWLLWAFAAGFAILAWLFSSLTVEVTESEFLWRFGPGLWRYRIARAEIDSVRIVRNAWWNGFGVRMRPGFRLYNVEGLDAVELRLKTGDVCRVGSDDPSGLAAALKS
jgi:hypothetical protein